MTKQFNYRVAPVNIEWSDDYTGSDTTGFYDGLGNERHNFQIAPDGYYYGYIPPNGASFPKPHGPGWLIFFVSTPPGGSDRVVVGWYEDATLDVVQARPDAEHLPPHPERDGEYSFSASTREAVAIPVPERNCILKNEPSFRNFIYLLHDPDGPAKRPHLLRLLLEYRQRIRGGEAGDVARRIEVSGYSTDPERSKEIEEAAIEAVIKDLQADEFTLYDDRQKDNCGWDLEFTPPNSKCIWCVEVKGTSNPYETFFLSRNEFARGRELHIAAKSRKGSSRIWRLAVVSGIDGDEDPDISYYDFDEMTKEFNLDPTCYRGTPKDKS